MTASTLTEDALKALNVADICRVDPATITNGTRFIADLNMDSLASLDLLTELEEEWESRSRGRRAQHSHLGELWAFIATQ